ncbi:MarR family transcriptional regulator [Streptomyces sp. B6B3]|uniref:GbsR/MarR family transcriptional regulator n=1 Tax=Streptomyces sp. B6B3 TaxID=3153570 RepID=UPI00325E549D
MIDPRPSAEPAGELGPEVATFMERLASDLVEAGMQRMGARAFACLMVSEEDALTAAELARRLQVSPAAVSGAVRYLAQVHLLSRERQPGSRRERYRLYQNAWYESLMSRDVMLKRWSQTLQAGLGVVPEGSAAHHRLAEMEEFIEFLDGELAGLLDRWRAHQAATSEERRAR